MCAPRRPTAREWARRSGELRQFSEGRQNDRRRRHEEQRKHRAFTPRQRFTLLDCAVFFTVAATPRRREASTRRAPTCFGDCVPNRRPRGGAARRRRARARRAGPHQADHHREAAARTGSDADRRRCSRRTRRSRRAATSCSTARTTSSRLGRGRLSARRVRIPRRRGELLRASLSPRTPSPPSNQVTSSLSLSIPRASPAS